MTVPGKNHSKKASKMSYIGFKGRPDIYTLKDLFVTLVR